MAPIQKEEVCHTNNDAEDRDGSQEKTTDLSSVFVFTRFDHHDVNQ
jgi:hypothetical protein